MTLKLWWPNLIVYNLEPQTMKRKYYPHHFEQNFHLLQNLIVQDVLFWTDSPLSQPFHYCLVCLHHFTPGSVPHSFHHDIVGVHLQEDHHILLACAWSNQKCPCLVSEDLCGAPSPCLLNSWSLLFSFSLLPGLSLATAHVCWIQYRTI